MCRDSSPARDSIRQGRGNPGRRVYRHDFPAAQPLFHLFRLARRARVALRCRAFPDAARAAIKPRQRLPDGRSRDGVRCRWWCDWRHVMTGPPWRRKHGTPAACGLPARRNRARTMGGQSRRGRAPGRGPAPGDGQSRAGLAQGRSGRPSRFQPGVDASPCPSHRRFISSTVASKAERLLGLMKCPHALNSNARARSECWFDDVSTTAGTCRNAARVCGQRNTSKPSAIGILRSSAISAGSGFWVRSLKGSWPSR
jgi:hypothetical protein